LIRLPLNTLVTFLLPPFSLVVLSIDVHVSLDDVVVMFHDPDLERTTDSTGTIKERNWYGENGIQHVRTKKEPRQAIPTFAETLELLMRPEHHHVKFNVDVKVQNDPERLFSLMHELISSKPDWETNLAPMLLLGLWHPRFLSSAKEKLPYCKRSYIGNSPEIARKYFWDDCHAFSIAFGALTSNDGHRFRQECKDSGKTLMVWTVNRPEHMMEAVRWEVNVILTDVTNTWLDLRKGLQSDYETIGSRYGRFFLWTTPSFYTPFLLAYSRRVHMRLEKIAGPFDEVSAVPHAVALNI